MQDTDHLASQKIHLDIAYFLGSCCCKVLQSGFFHSLNDNRSHPTEIWRAGGQDGYLTDQPHNSHFTLYTLHFTLYTLHQPTQVLDPTLHFTALYLYLTDQPQTLHLH